MMTLDDLAREAHEREEARKAVALAAMPARLHAALPAGAMEALDGDAAIAIRYELAPQRATVEDSLSGFAFEVDLDASLTPEDFEFSRHLVWAQLLRRLGQARARHAMQGTFGAAARMVMKIREGETEALASGEEAHAGNGASGGDGADTDYVIRAILPVEGETVGAPGTA